MRKTIIKLINNERVSKNILSAKAESLCASDSVDYCSKGYDFAICSNFAYDYCGKDYSACYNGADDYCTNVDSDSPCNGAGQEDYN
jgi:hypothetical protein